MNTLHELTSKYREMGCTVLLSESKGSIKLSTIIVPKNKRKDGIGTAFLIELTVYADATQQVVVLSPTDDFGGSKPRLIRFYKRFSFVENKGRKKNYYFRETMYRKPLVNEEIQENELTVKESC